MVAYSIEYLVKGAKNDGKLKYALIEAKDMKSAKKKLAKKHGYKDGRMIQVERVVVIGYF